MNILETLKILLSLFSIEFLGLGILFSLEKIFKKKEHFSFFFQLSLAWGIGLGLIVLWLQILNICNFEWSFLNSILIIFLVAVWLNLICCSNWLSLYKKYKNIDNVKTFIKTKLEKGFVFYIIILFLFFTSFFMTHLKPFSAWDEFSIWGFKANIFFHEKGIELNNFPIWLEDYIHADYPILLPLSLDYIYLSIGDVNETLGKIIFPFFYIFLGGAFYRFLQEEIKNKEKLKIALLILLATPIVFVYSFHAYADLPLSYFVTISILFLRKYSKKGKLINLFLSFLFGALASCVKNEGLVFFFFIFFFSFVIFLRDNLYYKHYNLKETICLFINKKNAEKGFLLLLPIILFVLPWQIYKIINNFKSDLLNVENFKILFNVKFILKRIEIIFINWFKHLFFYFHYFIFTWVVFFIILFQKGIKEIWKEEKVLLSILIYIFLIYSFFYLITPVDISWHIETSMERLILHVLPLGLFFVFKNLLINTKN